MKIYDGYILFSNLQSEEAGLYKIKNTKLGRLLNENLDRLKACLEPNDYKASDEFTAYQKEVDETRDSFTPDMKPEDQQAAITAINEKNAEVIKAYKAHRKEYDQMIKEKEMEGMEFKTIKAVLLPSDMNALQLQLMKEMIAD